MARTVEAIQADLDAAYAARTALLSGNQITTFERADRRLTFQGMRMSEVTDLINALERELESANAAANGRPRRRPITMVYEN